MTGQQPVTLNTDYLQRCLRTLETAYEQLEIADAEDVAYDILRAACVKEFEIVLEQCGSLLKQHLRPCFSSNGQADALVFKDVFRHAARHGLIPVDACQRWLRYRDNRNETAHTCGEALAEAVLGTLPEFIADTGQLAAVIGEPLDV